jgi:5'-nucleotidase
LNTPATTAGPTTAAQVAPLKILVSNDDGISHPGLDLLVRSLATLDNVELTIVAPASNQSGTSDQTTEGGADYADATTASGVAAIAVDGFPADSVRVALDELDLDPDLVVSGINDAQNIGPLAGLSGTVGVARTAVRDGIPAIAVSAGLTFVEQQFAVGAALVMDWIETNRQALADRTMPVEAISFNIPSCDPADMGDVVEVPLATTIPDGVNVFESSCDPSGPPPADDVLAITAGFPTRTVIPGDLESIIR